MTIDLQADYHVHSTFSDDAVATLAENLAAAKARGLHTIRLVEHVRRSTAWVPDFVAALVAEPVPSGLRVLNGVEAKLLDSRGALDLPNRLDGVDIVLVADHRFPGPDNAWTPREARRKLEDGLAVPEALDMLVESLVGAMRSLGGGQLAHSFSILPKIGLTEDLLSKSQLQHWASSAARTGSLVEVNEKWGCPGPRTIAAAVTAGCTLVAASDSHSAEDVGRYERIPQLISQTAP